MSYRISYKDNMVIFPVEEPKSNKFSLKEATIMVWLIVAGLVLWQHKTTVAECLVPGDNTVTVSAFHNLVDNVSEGTDLTDSIAVFCREILDHGQIPG